MSRVGRNAGWRAAGIALDLARVAITMPIVARQLGAADYGRWSIAGTAVAVFMACIVTGMNDALVRECAITPGAERGLLRAGTRLRLLLVACGMPAIVVTTLLVGDAPTAAVAAVMCVGLFAEAVATRAVLLTVHLEERRRLPARAVLAVLSIAATIAIAAQGGGLVAFAVLFAAQLAAGAWASAHVARPLVRTAPDREPPRSALWPLAWPMVLVCSLEVVHLQVDVLVVGAAVGPEGAGVLGAAVRIAYLPLLVLGAVTASALPELARLGRRGARPVALRLALRTGLAGLAVPIGFALGAPVVVALFGAEYGALRWLLPVLGLRVALAAFSGPLGTCALATGRQRANLAVSVAVVVVETIALVIVAPRWGLAGAAAVVVAAEVPKALLLYSLLEPSPCTSPR